MAVTFQFRAPDTRLRSTMAVETVDAAVAHVCDVLNGADVAEGRKWTIDEDGENVPQADWLRLQFQRHSPVTLYDQDSLGTLETVEICAA